jgi:hypothetical protein
MTAPACPRCGSTITNPLRRFGRIVEGRFQCFTCERWFGPNNPPDAGGAGGTGEPASAPLAEKPSLDEDIADAIAVLMAIPEGEDLPDDGDDSPLARVERLVRECQRLRAEKREREVEFAKAVAAEREACAAMVERSVNCARGPNAPTERMALHAAKACIEQADLLARTIRARGPL